LYINVDIPRRRGALNILSNLRSKRKARQKKGKKLRGFDLYHVFTTNQLKQKASKAIKELGRIVPRMLGGVETGFKMKKYL